MKQNSITKTLAISGVIGGIVLLNSTPAYADEFSENNNVGTQEENINGRLAKKGQVVNVDGTYLRIRANASTNAEVVGTMTEGMTFDIISKEGQWYEIQYNNITGYVFGDYVQEVSTSVSENVLYTGTVYNAAPNLRVRSGGSLNSSIIGYVLDNSTVSIVGVENEWYKIKYNGAYGYVHSDYVSIQGNVGTDGNTSSGGGNTSAGGDDAFTATGYVYDLGGSSLRVRQSPSTTGNIIGSLYEGNTVNIIGKVEGWYKISYNSSIAYISADYVTLDKPSDSNNSNSTPSTPDNVVISKGQVVNVEGSNLRVRQSAATDSLVLGYLLNNSTVDIVGQEGSWYKINFKDSVGYVSSDYIRLLSNDSNTGGESSGGDSQEDSYNIIYNAMMAQVGAPYVWGGSGEYLTTSLLNELKGRFPEDAAAGEYTHAEKFVDLGYRAFDCSGLMQWAYAQAGINIGRTTYNQINNGVEVSLNSLKAGDLLFASDLGHVGMYIGNDQWIEASYTSDYVRVRNVPWSYVSRARRILN